MQGMRRLILFVCGFALFSASTASAQESLLPKQFSNWKLRDCSAKPMEFGFGKEAGQREVSFCQFTAEGKTVGVWSARYHDPSSAFEVYTSQPRPGMMPTSLGQVAAFDKDGVLILEGTVVLSSTANISREDLGALVKALEAKSERSPLPPIRTYLPTTGRLLGSERYALGPEAFRAALNTVGESEMAALVGSAGFSDNAEAMMARYTTGANGSGVLLLLEYPTPNLAEQYIHHLDEVLTAEAKAKGTTIERKGSVLSLVLSPSSPEFAKSLRESIDYETKVTWNEASQTATDPPILTVLQKIFIGTGIFMIAAVVLGVAFGGVRVITKRFFPGKVFDRPNQMEVLQLGLSGKRIDPTDFY